VGITFHVGSQCVDTHAFVRAIALAGEVAETAGGIDDLDVGGGFPAIYRGDEPEFDEFVAAIEHGVIAAGLDCALQCEPGRALVAEGASVLARVELRRGKSLYLNDGVYGNLAELKWIGPQFPMRVVRASGVLYGPQAEFDLFGPTCDSIDSMPGPHYLPRDVVEGDWVEVGMMGAYSNALRTGFNGFGSDPLVLLGDGGWYLPAMRDLEAAVAA
jgi:ornithine decarboxylase